MTNKKSSIHFITAIIFIISTNLIQADEIKIWEKLIAGIRKRRDLESISKNELADNSVVCRA